MNYLVRTIASFLSLLLMVGFAIAQDQTAKNVDAFIAAEMQKQKIPGVSLAVIKDGKPLIVKGYGFSNVEHQVPVKPETIFQSGSVGKQFTAFAVMLLVDEGKISLDEKINKYLGEVPESWKNITVRHLLTHTGGMTDYPRDFDFRKDLTEDELLKAAMKAPLAFSPGEKWQYSNLGYLTLGVIIHKASGKFYGDFLQERVFKPFGMTTARIISEADIVPNRAAGYQLVKGELKNQEWVSPALNTTADGALYLTALDMIKWDEALNQRKLLKKESYELMWSPVTLNDGKTHPYGFGWMFASVNGKKLIEHGGAWQGFKAHISRYPDNKLTVIVFANLINANQGKLANGVAAIVDTLLVPKPIADTEPQLTAIFRGQLEKLADGKPDLDLFTPEMQQIISGQQDRFSTFIKSMGEIKAFELMSRTETPKGITYRYRVAFATETAYMNVTRQPDGKISGLGFQPA